MKTKFSKSTLVALFAAMAATAFGLSSCSTSAGTGALIGGGTGAVVGGARGAAIGAGVGAVGGAIVDEARDWSQRATRRPACMGGGRGELCDADYE